MKALLISEIFPPQHGGSGRWFWEVYSRLSKTDYVLAVGTYPGYVEFDETHDLTVERLDLSSNNWGAISSQGLKYYLRTFLQLRKLIKAHRVDQLHCGRCLPEGVMAYIIWLVYRVPYKCFIHGEDVETAALSRELSWMLRKVFSKASTLICNSQNSANILLDKWQVPESKVIVLHPGVDATRFVPAPKNDITKRSLGWDDKTVILTVGRLQKRKGQDMIIKALPAIIKQEPNVLYAIIGDGEQRKSLISLADELGVAEHVMFMGEVSDNEMIQSYQQCDIFALPNRTIGNDIEGFGMVLVEAQACGKPVIAGDSGGTSETMVKGETGFIVDCSTPEPLAKQMIHLLSSPHLMSELQINARKHIEDNLDWKSLTKSIEIVFQGSPNEKL